MNQIQQYIEVCPKCTQKNRIKPHSLRLKPVCHICKSDLPDPFRLGEEIWEGEGIHLRRFAFELLPPGKWDIEMLIKHFEREAAHLPFEINKGDLQPHRLREIKKLEPEECYIGTEGWLGYVVFTFKHSAKVVLECPIEGNATYVLKGNWKPMVRNSKKELRSRYPHRYKKIVHKGDWFSRIRSALGYWRRFE